MTAHEALVLLVAAWESLPEGYHRPGQVQVWLVDEMKPAIDRARSVLADCNHNWIYADRNAYADCTKCGAHEENPKP